MSKLLIFGGGSFTAAHFVKHSQTRWEEMCVTRRRGAAPGTLAYATPLPCDVWSAADVDAVIAQVRPTAAVYLAATTVGDVDTLRATNVSGILNVVSSVARHVPNARVLHVGSASEYGCVADEQLPITEHQIPHPSTEYGQVKLEGVTRALAAAADAGISLLVARPFNIVGPGMPSYLLAGALMERMRTALKEGSDTIALGDFEAERDYLAVSDLTAAYDLLLHRGVDGEIYNICSGRAVTVREVAAFLLDMAPRKLRLLHDPTLRGQSSCRRVYGSPAKIEALGFRAVSTWQEALRDAWKEL